MMITTLFAALIVAILFALYYKGNNKLKTQIHSIESLLIDDSLTIIERIEEAKTICRYNKGIVFYGIYCILKAIEKSLKKNELLQNR